MSAEQYAWNELQRTRDRVAALEAALRDVFNLIDEGFLCRSTKLDHKPDWAIRVTRGLKRLADAHRLIDAESAASGDQT